jgi:hypothetical protein
MGASGAISLPLLGLWLWTQDDRNEPFHQARHNDSLVETAIVHSNHYQQSICLDHCPAHSGFREEGTEQRPRDLCGAEGQEQEQKQLCRRL